MAKMMAKLDSLERDRGRSGLTSWRPPALRSTSRYFGASQRPRSSGRWTISSVAAQQPRSPWYVVHECLSNELFYLGYD